MDRIILTASDGMYYTNGISGGEIIYLAEGETADGWYEIPKDEFIASIEMETFNGTGDGVSEQDYQNALKEFGVVL